MADRDNLGYLLMNITQAGTGQEVSSYTVIAQLSPQVAGSVCIGTLFGKTPCCIAHWGYVLYADALDSSVRAFMHTAAASFLKVQSLQPSVPCKPPKMQVLR